MKSLQSQTRFAECPGVEQCNDASQLWAWRTFSKLKSASFEVFCCGAHGREKQFFKAIKSLQAKNSNSCELGQPVDPSSFLCLWGFSYRSWSCLESTRPHPMHHSPCSIFKLETRRFAGSLCSETRNWNNSWFDFIMAKKDSYLKHCRSIRRQWKFWLPCLYGPCWG